ncbi:uncharacterized protein PV09_09764 [Verruconis gallopava]|uniref:Uncharacterized protein n=1 Tax=Verruconis gallopava TaxID=253628 RepID=A0A0D1ZWL0_9PEZI|nr:uncharacterized protein PV09_09764 [Verruconis gallopava]KIV98414.1 hypothetical protein PV09_09764 [Verruconis gallopava]
MAGKKRPHVDSDTEEEKSNATRYIVDATEHKVKEEVNPKDQPSQDQSKQGMKRSRVDSDTEEEKSNAKRYIVDAMEHKVKEEVNPKDRPSQDQSKQGKTAEQHDAELKVEENSGKRARKSESTDAPQAQRKNDGSAANQGRFFYDYGRRTKLRTSVRACKTPADCASILNKIPAGNLVELAFALNDAKEDHRRQLFGMLPKTVYPQIVDILVNAYQDKTRYDSKFLFPHVAFSKVLQTLPQDERICNICKGDFEELEDMIPKGCGKHSFHKKCLIKQLNRDELPFFALCSCF